MFLLNVDLLPLAGCSPSVCGCTFPYYQAAPPSLLHGTLYQTNATDTLHLINKLLLNRQTFRCIPMQLAVRAKSVCNRPYALRHLCISSTVLTRRCLPTSSSSFASFFFATPSSFHSKKAKQHAFVSSQRCLLQPGCTSSDSIASFRDGCGSHEQCGMVEPCVDE